MNEVFWAVIAQLCSHCGESTYMDEFPSKDGTPHCGPCFFINHALDEGWEQERIIDYTIGLYTVEFAAWICGVIGVPWEAFAKELEDFNG